MKQSEHGGNIYRLADELKIQEREVIDFSASVNPLGVSKKVKAEIRRQLKYLHRYPDPDAKRLRKRLGQHHAIDPGTVLCGNGSTELICLITKAFSPQRVLVPAPTYSEYERAVHSAMRQDERAQIQHVVLKAEDGYAISGEKYIHALQRGWSTNASHSNHYSSLPFEMAFLCNPNNPTGRLLRRQQVSEIADAAKECGCYLIVDEAFIDFSPDNSVVEEVADNPYLIVLRSMTHFYALAGLRLGYGIFPTNVIERLQQYRAPWTVNILAQKAAAAALKDKAYRKESMAVLRQEKTFFEKTFRKLGITFFPSDANFYLVKTAVAPEICRHLRKKGILVRDCLDFKELDSSYMRIAVKSHRENTIFVRELKKIVAPGE